MWDLAISENGDLVISGNRDLSGKAGTDLLEQRMIIRLKMPQGSWIYDTSQMGSRMTQLYGMDPVKADTLAPQLVRQALQPMSGEITVDNVNVFIEDHAIQMLILYRILDSGIPGAENGRQLQVTLPLAGGV